MKQTTHPPQRALSPAVRLPGGLLLLPAGDGDRQELRARGPARSDPAGHDLGRDLFPPRALVHDLAGGPLDRADPGAGAAGGVRLRPLPLPRQAPAASADDDPVCAAGDGGLGGVRGAARPARLAERAADGRARPQSPAHPPPADDLADPDRPRLLQHLGGHPRGRRLLGPSRYKARRCGPDVGRQPAARGVGDHPAAVDAGHRGGRIAGLPLLLHQLRRDPDPRRADLRHAGSRDLPPIRDPVPPGRCRGAQPGADGADLRRHGGLRRASRRGPRRR